MVAILMTSLIGPNAELRWANWLKLLQIPQSSILYRSPKIVTKFTRDHFFGPFDIDYVKICWNFHFFYSCSYAFSFGRHCTLCNVIIKMTQCANVYDVIYCKKSVTLKMVYNKKKIQIFGMNMPFISSREARKCIFHSWPRMKYTFSRFTRWNKWHIHSKDLNILYVLKNV